MKQQLIVNARPQTAEEAELDMALRYAELKTRSDALTALVEYLVY